MQSTAALNRAILPTRKRYIPDYTYISRNFTVMWYFSKKECSYPDRLRSVSSILDRYLRTLQMTCDIEKDKSKVGDLHAFGVLSQPVKVNGRRIQKESAVQPGEFDTTAIGRIVRDAPISHKVDGLSHKSKIAVVMLHVLYDDCR